MFDITLRTANRLYDLSNSAQLLGAALVLIGTFGAVWSGHVRDRHADADRLKLEAKVAPRHLSDQQTHILTESFCLPVGRRRKFFGTGVGSRKHMHEI